ncbi:fibrous sheath CABYR-binding protein isoform X9 [Macrobrachium rosenbergii]|uniref:fibrous sheath CABYR-binding protein isoform X9 n=1 Tax=Macrobrachium rosenbergii TaxID=79674 RepID=UPI0034D46C21
MSGEFGTGKTIFVLAIVVGCFAVLWPKIFYPMLTASVTSPSSGRQVLWKDEANVYFLHQLCYLLEEQHQTSTGAGSPMRWTGDECWQVLKTACGVEVSEALVSDVRLGKDKSNLTNCLATRYSLTPAIVAAAAPPRVRPRPYFPQGMGPHARPERPPHLYPEMMHPALREKGRAMPQRTIDKQARPGPMPGVRPPMGGAGGIVPPPQTKGSGAMGIIMPLYTVGIVVFFVYTIMKVLFKKGQDDDKTPKLKDFGLDPEYRKYVFAEEYLDNTDISTKDQMRRQAREESRNRKKNQTEVPPDTKIGKTECEKKLDQFSNEIEARKKKRLEELARLIELDKEERRLKEEEGAPNPQQLDEDEFLDALATEATYEREDESSSSPSRNTTKSFPSHLHDDLSDADTDTTHTTDRDADDFQSTNTNASESTSLDTDTTTATLGTGLDLSVVLPENEKNTPISDPITQISATQLVIKSNIPPMIEAVSEAQINSNSLVQVYETSDISMQTCVPNAVCKEQAPCDVQTVNVNSVDISSDQPLTTNSTPTPPTSVIPSSTPKIANHISTSLTSNRQNVHSKEIYSNKQSPQPQVPQQCQNTNFSNVPTKKVKQSTPCNIAQQQCPSAPNNKHKNKRKRSRKRGKKRGGSAWPSPLSINPVIDRVEEVGEMTSEEDLTSSEALTTTLSEDTSLPASLQRHLEEIQVEQSNFSDLLKEVGQLQFEATPPLGVSLNGTLPQAEVTGAVDNTDVQGQQVSALGDFIPAGRTVIQLQALKDDGVSAEEPEAAPTEEEPLPVALETEGAVREEKPNIEVQIPELPEKREDAQPEKEKEFQTEAPSDVHETETTPPAVSVPEKVCEEPPCPPVTCETEEKNELIDEPDAEEAVALPVPVFKEDTPKPTAELPVVLTREMSSEGSSEATETGADISDLRSFAEENANKENAENNIPAQQSIVPPLVMELSVEKEEESVSVCKGQGTQTSFAFSVPTPQIDSKEDSTQTEKEQEVAVLGMNTSFRHDEGGVETKGGSRGPVPSHQVTEILLDALLPSETQLLVKDAQVVGSSHAQDIEIEASEAGAVPCVVTSNVSLAFLGLEHRDDITPSPTNNSTLIADDAPDNMQQEVKDTPVAAEVAPDNVHEEVKDTPIIDEDRKQRKHQQQVQIR